jgi:hypothetical protein
MVKPISKPIVSDRVVIYHKVANITILKAKSTTLVN